ncbi:hypothetical protein JXA80_11630 [bacterium]|nr:hypothetical protein [candidate division CSSED10-310 bacterium]
MTSYRFQFMIDEFERILKQSAIEVVRLKTALGDTRCNLERVIEMLDRIDEVAGSLRNDMTNSMGIRSVNELRTSIDRIHGYRVWHAHMKNRAVELDALHQTLEQRCDAAQCRLIHAYRRMKGFQIHRDHSRKNTRNKQLKTEKRQNEEILAIYSEGKGSK